MEKKSLVNWSKESIISIVLIISILLQTTFTGILVKRIDSVKYSVDMMMESIEERHEEYVTEDTNNDIGETTTNDIFVESEPIESIPEETVTEIVEDVTSEPTLEPEPTPEPTLYFDVPLDANLQEHIVTLCDEYGIEPSLVVAIINKESKYNASVVGDSGRSFGLMQIQPRWHQARMAELGCTDLLDPYQNVAVGIDYLADLFNMSGSTAWVLMAYNGGPAHANKNIAQGTISNYASTVLYINNNLNS